MRILPSLTNRPVGDGRSGSCCSSWARLKGHLLPFCSHIILKDPQVRDTKKHDATSYNSSSFLMFFARSEGYRHGLETTHNPKVAGSNPAPATKQAPEIADGLRGFVSQATARLCTNCVRTRRELLTEPTPCRSRVWARRLDGTRGPRPRCGLPKPGEPGPSSAAP